MSRATVAAGEILPVIRCTQDMIFETTLSADAEEAKLGYLLEVSAGGLQVDAANSGSFEVTGIEGTVAGSTVYGRFQ